MKTIQVISGAAFCACLILGTGCSKPGEHSAVESSGAGKGTAPAADVAKKTDDAMVRFVNATPSAKDLAFGDATQFTDVKARDVTGYKLVPAERHDFKLFLNGSNAQAMATDSEGLTAGKHYTVVAVTQPDGSFKLDDIADDLMPPDPGKAKVRIINAAPDASTVDLFTGADNRALFSNTALGQATDYKQVIPSEANLSIQVSGQPKSEAPVKDVELQPGKLYTILVFGDKNGKIKVKTVEDEFTDVPDGTKS